MSELVIAAMRRRGYRFMSHYTPGKPIRHEFYKQGSNRVVLWVNEGLTWDEFVTEFCHGKREGEERRCNLAEDITRNEWFALYSAVYDSELRPPPRVDWGDDRP